MSDRAAIPTLRDILVTARQMAGPDADPHWRAYQAGRAEGFAIALGLLTGEKPYELMPAAEILAAVNATLDNIDGSV